MKEKNVSSIQQLSKDELGKVEAGYISADEQCEAWDTCPNRYPGCYSGGVEQFDAQ